MDLVCTPEETVCTSEERKKHSVPSLSLQSCLPTSTDPRFPPSSSSFPHTLFLLLALPLARAVIPQLLAQRASRTVMRPSPLPPHPTLLVHPPAMSVPGIAQPALRRGTSCALSVPGTA
eukprot:2398415-Rhodomonas_salina.1